ncbi:MAG: hypothetical protein SOZ52_03675 [Pyramidobacter sp.]|nr:hypothetical protein [Pyramidobacter sp.]
MKKICAALFLIVFICGVSWADDDPLDKQIDRLENIVYGSSPRPGGLINRLDAVEKDLYGTELQGSLADRQSAHIDFLEHGSNGQPSLLFKLSVAEWGLELPNGAHNPLGLRISEIEKRLEGVPQDGKPLAMRVERAIGMIISEPVAWEQLQIPEGTVVRLALLETLKPAVVKKDDTVKFCLTENLLIGDRLVAPRGAPALGRILSVRKPGMFGRPSQIKIQIESLNTVGADTLPLTEGKQAQKAAEFEASYAAAAGTSLVGAIALGPLGLVGGAFIRGNAKEIPAGTIVYAQTASAASVYAYPVPESLKSLAEDKRYLVVSKEQKVELQAPEKMPRTAPAETEPAPKKEIDSL